MPDVGYDEFATLHDAAAEWGLEVEVPHVRRVDVPVEGLRHVSALVWGDCPADVSLLHGSGQNAHTFDVVALALARPLVALDLPHHGHSDASPYGPMAPVEHARDVATALGALRPARGPLVGMSYGGLVGIALANQAPDLLTHLVLVDITPGVRRERASSVLDFLAGPESFASLEEMLDRTREFTPGRSESSLRRGISHNALQRPDGRWVWRHQSHGPALLRPQIPTDRWGMLETCACPVTLIRALGPSSVVSDEDADEFRRRRPHDRVIEVPDASHSIQGSHPLELAALLDDIVSSSLP